MREEMLLALLQYGGIAFGVLAVFLTSAAVLLAIKTPPKQLRREIVELAPPPPEPVKPKKRVIQAVIPERDREQLETLLQGRWEAPRQDWDRSCGGTERRPSYG